MSTEEMQFILAHKWAQLGLTLAADDFTDAEAVAAIVRITGGNFRLILSLKVTSIAIQHVIFMCDNRLCAACSRQARLPEFEDWEKG